jgi:hypothetical protein
MLPLLHQYSMMRVEFCHEPIQLNKLLETESQSLNQMQLTETKEEKLQKL